MDDSISCYLLAATGLAVNVYSPCSSCWWWCEHRVSLVQPSLQDVSASTPNGRRGIWFIILYGEMLLISASNFYCPFSQLHLSGLLSSQASYLCQAWMAILTGYRETCELINYHPAVDDDEHPLRTFYPSGSHGASRIKQTCMCQVQGLPLCKWMQHFHIGAACSSASRAVQCSREEGVPGWDD